MQRREKIFLILASAFISSLIAANLIGITKFFEFRVPLWGYRVMVPVGIIPYPITFLATDLICELYGRRRANYLVFVGFLMNLFLIFICGVGQSVSRSEVWLKSLEEPWHAEVYPRLWNMVWIGVQGSMAAYLVAQLVDVQLFHFWKRLTQGKHLWLRNNASTMVSQLVDSSVILAFVFGAQAATGELEADSPFGSDAKLYGFAALGVFILNSYLFKVFFAALDTPFAYFFKALLKPWVGEPDAGEPRYAAPEEGTA